MKNEGRPASEIHLDSAIPPDQTGELPRQPTRVLELLENSNDVFYGLDREWRFTYLNRRAETLWGRTRDQLIGKNIWEEFPQSVETPAYAELHRALAEQRTLRFETYSQILGIWIEVEAYPTESGLGVYFHDISQRKQIQAEQAHFAALVQSSDDAIISKSLGGIVTSWNPASERIFGYSADEMIGQPITRLIPSELLDEEERFLQAIAAGQTVRNFDTIRVKKDGNRIDVSITLSPITDPQGQIVAASKIVRDITERKQAEEAQWRYAERLAAINHLDRIIASNIDIIKVYDNFVAELRMLIPVDLISLIRLNDAGDQWRVTREWNQNEPSSPRGRKGPVQGSVLEWLAVNRAPLMEAELGERGIWQETEKLKQAGIRSQLLLPLIVQERVLGVLAVASQKPNTFSEEMQSILMTIADQLSIAIQKADLYEQVQRHAAELEQHVRMRTAELEAANKELEAFTYSVSHDLRAPLRAIDGFSRMILRDYQALLPDEGQRRLGIVRENAQQMGQLIDDLLTFSRLNRQPLTRQPVDLTELANRIMVDLRSQEKSHPVELIIEPLPPAQADPALLKQVMVNLLSNAMKFTRKCEAASIKIGYHEDNDEIIYFVKDNGAGFDMRYVDKLFGVFQRLHRADEFEGTGVGLAIVQRIIHRHTGRVWAEAEVDKGATFYFTLGKEVEHDGE